MIDQIRSFHVDSELERRRTCFIEHLNANYPEQNVVVKKGYYSVDSTPAYFLWVLKDALANSVGGYQLTHLSKSLLELMGKNEKVTINLEENFRINYYSTKQQKYSYTVLFTGLETWVDHVMAKIDTMLEGQLLKYVAWWVEEEGHFSVKHVILDKPLPVLQNAYPWFNNNPTEFFDKYMEAPAPLLFLSGPKGTGKTSFLRNMVYDKDLDVAIGYSHKLLENDNFFVEFLTGDEDILILEDVDVLMLASREDGQNHIMSRFLNVSDGLVKFPEKKIVFTSNIQNFSKIDDALMRPGRCYEFVKFRELDYTEASAVTKELGKPELTDTNRTYSLAELTNGTNSFAKEVVGNFKMGF